jgi:hypothetical protein
MRREGQSIWLIACKVIEPVVPKTGGEGRFEGREGATLLGDTGDGEGVSEAVCSFEGVGNVSLSREI